MADHSPPVTIIYHGYAMRWLRPDLMHEATIVPAPAKRSGDQQAFLALPGQAPAAPAKQALMALPEHVKTPPKQRGHAARPGTGPVGETCGGCASSTTKRGQARTYRKCLLAKAKWSRGAGSDIGRNDPACIKWTAKEKPHAVG